MNAVALVEQESGCALGFYCSSCGRPQLPMHCQNGADTALLTELHRKAEACCTHSVCQKHQYQLHGWHLCPHCVLEGPEGRAAAEMPAPVSTPAKRSRKAAAQ
jgi:hypothetical protein